MLVATAGSVAPAMRSAFLRLARYDGVVARLGAEERPLLRDPRLRISEARVTLRIG